MSWNKQSLIPSGGAAGAALVKSSSADYALGWANRAHLASRTDTYVLVANTTVQNPVSESVFGVAAVGDLLVVDVWGTVLNNTAAPANFTFFLKAGDSGNYAGATSVFTTAAWSVAQSPNNRYFHLRCVAALTDSSMTWFSAQLDTANPTIATDWALLNAAGCWRGRNNINLAWDTRAQSIYFGVQMGTADPNVSIIARAVRAVRVPA